MWYVLSITAIYSTAIIYSGVFARRLSVHCLPIASCNSVVDVAQHRTRTTPRAGSTSLSSYSIVKCKKSAHLVEESKTKKNLKMRILNSVFFVQISRFLAIADWCTVKYTAQTNEPTEPFLARFGARPSENKNKMKTKKKAKITTAPPLPSPLQNREKEKTKRECVVYCV